MLDVFRYRAFRLFGFFLYASVDFVRDAYRPVSFTWHLKPPSASPRTLRYFGNINFYCVTNVTLIVATFVTSDAVVGYNVKP
jgi:hypothetical protein